MLTEFLAERYDTKLLLMRRLPFWSSLPLHSGPLCTGAVVPVRVLSMNRVDLCAKKKKTVKINGKYKVDMPLKVISQSRMKP